jgi:pyruvate/2-oxoglutarate dehydrogenase complex dihydrolipoamide dehydrogenase (E3) component
VVIFERAAHIGGQVQLASGTPGHREQAAALCANYQALLDRGNVDVRLSASADADAIAALQPDLVIIATGARPAPPQQRLADVELLQAWDVLAGARPKGRVLIADWGGDAAALDCAELLAGEGHEVTLAAGSVMPGETLHQYARNQYLARLARARVRIEHHLGLHSAGEGVVRFRNIFAPELEQAIETDALVLSLGRVPEDGLLARLRERGKLTVQAAGDCRSPRGLEEAILEGTLAARNFLAATKVP